MHSGDLNGAIADFTSSMSYCVPGTVSFRGPLSELLNRGSAKHLLGDLVGAIADLTEALQLESPDAVYAPLMRGRARMDAKDFDGAIADFTLAIHNFPGLPNAYRLRAAARGCIADQQGANEDLAEYQRLGGCDLPAFA